MNILSILIGAGAYLGVSYFADTYIFKKDFDAKQTLVNTLIVLVVLGFTAVLTKKTGLSHGKGLLEVSDKIATK